MIYLKHILPESAMRD